MAKRKIIIVEDEFMVYCVLPVSVRNPRRIGESAIELAS